MSIYITVVEACPQSTSFLLWFASAESLMNWNCNWLWHLLRTQPLLCLSCDRRGNRSSSWFTLYFEAIWMAGCQPTNSSSRRWLWIAPFHHHPVNGRFHIHSLVKPFERPVVGLQLLALTESCRLHHFVTIQSTEDFITIQSNGSMAMEERT